ncbi:MAG: tRNA preQ1(34) S-adenosylmethionine ribosyltransferase-isomerase QueA [Deltaproteobacteria bacterium]|nr:tRNA preQ1(34) S-adenosylmethionine ribosyltransferase-isomerase QueA [Deltaproteobacteria bacterium]
MDIKEFDYDLPTDLVAQYPKEDRASSKLLVFFRQEGSTHHDFFRNIGSYLRKGDVLVLNNTKVIPARLDGKKSTGGKVEILLVERKDAHNFICLVRNSGKKESLDVTIGDVRASLKKEEKSWILHLPMGNKDFERIIGYGKIPLPPYIKRKVEDSDFERYQTVYAKVEGSIAAPTAGLHFTKELLKELEEKGVEILFITLHVGIGTFLPVKSEKVEEHTMHREYFSMEKMVLEKIELAKRENRRVIACGTSTVRTLETVFSEGERRLSGYTELFIYPGYKFSVVDGLITNFHLPKSTPLILVCAFAGKENIFRCYREAIEKNYRFYSYGDAMLIL